jgi:hypothetical protein
MAVDRSKTMLLIAAWPDKLVAPELIVWGMTHKFRRIQWYSKRFTECAYNSAVERLALPSECQHFIFADRDMRPGPDTGPFLKAEGELVACEFDLAANESWEDPQAMHCGLWRCSRRVLEAIKPPWFQRVFSATGSRQERCPCLLLPRQGPRRRLHSRPRRLVLPPCQSLRPEAAHRGCSPPSRGR